MFYNGAPHVALNRVWHFFRWEKIDAQVERALRSIGSYEDLVGRGRSQHVLPLSSGEPPSPAEAGRHHRHARA